MPFQEFRGGSDQNSNLGKGVDSLKRGLKVTMDRLDQFLSHQKKDHAMIQEIQQGLDVTRDELAAWGAPPATANSSGNWGNQNEVEEPYQAPTTALTVMASKGDVEIDVTDPERYPIGKFIVDL